MDIPLGTGDAGIAHHGGVKRWQRAQFRIVVLLAFPQFVLGYLGMPRRYYLYPPEWQSWNLLSSAGASILAFAYLLPLFYLTWSLLRGPRATANPWNATGLEWQTSSPQPEHNFDTVPVVDSPPYAYRPDVISPAVVQAREGIG